MPLTYEQDSRLKALLPVLEEHGEWMGRILRQIFYPESDQAPEFLVIPKSFDLWIAQAVEGDMISPDMHDKLRRMHDDLGGIAAEMIAQSDSIKFKPDIARYDAFMVIYDEFISHVRRLERDVAMADNGIDFLTGLRSRQMLMKDLEREMERRSRRGRPFCLALARIDHYADMKASLSPPDYERVVGEVGNIIKLCMRSFDDAYRLGKGEFLMSLKQTDLTGGTAGLGRLRKLLEEKAPSYVLKGKDIHLTMSSCVAEPQPGDDFEALMNNMRVDLDRFGGHDEAALEYLEQSPLQRFVSALDDDGKKIH